MPANVVNSSIAVLIGGVFATGCSHLSPSVEHREVPRNAESTIFAMGMWEPDDCVYARPEIVITSNPGHGKATVIDQPASDFPDIVKGSQNCIDPDEPIKVLNYRPKEGYVGADQIEFFTHSFEGEGARAFRLIISVK